MDTQVSFCKILSNETTIVESANLIYDDYHDHDDNMMMMMMITSLFLSF